MATKKSPEDLIAKANEGLTAQLNEKYYHEFPHPFPALPRPGHPMTDQALTDPVMPILRGVHALLLGQAETQVRESLDVGAPHGSFLLASQVELALYILNRWWDECDDAERR